MDIIEERTKEETLENLFIKPCNPLSIKVMSFSGGGGKGKAIHK